jgi:hypothetical protein
MPGSIYHTPWRDRLLIGCLFICLSPIILPLCLWDFLSFRWTLWRFLRGSTVEAWDRYVPLWSQARCACGGQIGPSLTTPLVHSLAEHFARYHPDARPFLTAQLSNTDPILAAYAFKCLIRFDPIFMDDLPAEVLARSEAIEALRFGCVMEMLPLGQYMREYFQTSDYIKRGLVKDPT